MHLRRQIREAVATTLAAGPGLAGRVTATRLIPYHQDQLPQVAIYTVDEESTLDGTSNTLVREMSLQVEIVFAANAGLDTALDDLAETIEVEMAADRTLGGRAYDCVLRNTRFAIHGEGEQKTGHGVLTYTVTYRTARAVPSQTNP